MRSLSVRNIDEDTVRHLRVRAAKRGVSMEEEVRRILREAAAPPPPLGTQLARIFAPVHTFDEPFVPPPREPTEPLDLS